jgi:spore maturation protein CgeB
MQIVIVGLAITSSWGNGHATTYRSLVKGLHALGHHVLFLEQDQPWYAEHRDQPASPHADVRLYRDRAELEARFAPAVRAADAVILGSYVPDGAQVGDWLLAAAGGVRAFYDIDTPVTLAALAAGRCGYLRPDQVAAYDVMLSFTGGPTLARLQAEFGARAASALYCSVDLDGYAPVEGRPDLDLSYMGTFSDDRQQGLDELLLVPARRRPDWRFAVAGAQYPAEIRWPANVERIEHLPPAGHAAFYGRSRCTLNLTRADMRLAGWSPSVRLFEAGACAVPIVTDRWPGLEDVFEPGREVLVVDRGDDVVRILESLSPADRRRIGGAARERVLAQHGSRQRARELVGALERASRIPAAPPGRVAGARRPQAAV